MSTMTIPNNVRIQGSLVPQGFSPPAGCISNAAIAVAADIDPAKMGHQHAITYTQDSGADVASKTRVVHVARGAGEVIGVQIAIDTAPNGGNKLFTVDVKKSTAGGVFATILTGVVTVDDDDTDRSVVSGTLIPSPTFVAGDILEVVIAASGSTGSQGQGVAVVITTREDAD